MIVFLKALLQEKETKKHLHENIQIKENTNVMSFRELKVKTLDSNGWRLLHFIPPEIVMVDNGLAF